MKLLALAIQWKAQLRERQIKNCAALARAGQVSLNSPEKSDRGKGQCAKDNGGRRPLARNPPSGSVLIVGAVSFVCAMLANLGGGNQEAYQLLNNTSGIVYALAYLAMFAIPLVACGEKPSLNVRIAAAFGFLMTLLYIVLSVFPIVKVANAGRFTAQIVTVVVGLQRAGALYFWRAERRRRALSPDQEA